MHKTLLTLIIGLTVLVAGPALATTSSTANCDSDTGTLPYQKGWYHTSICRNICNKVIATDTACTEFDFDDFGMPDLVVLEREENDANCSDAGGPVFTITTGPTTGGSPSYDLTTSTVVLNDTVTRVTVDNSSGILDRYLFTAISSATACTDVDLRIQLIYRRAQN